MDLASSGVIALIVVIVVMVIIIVAYRARRNDGDGVAGYTGSESLCSRDCYNRQLELSAFDGGMSGEYGVGPCADRYRGISPFLPPNRKCYATTLNPFWAPQCDGAVVTDIDGYYDVPVSRAIDDRDPLE